jgi:hypothetical protein
MRRCIASSMAYLTAAWSNWLRTMTFRLTSPTPPLMRFAKPCRRAVDPWGGRLTFRSLSSSSATSSPS